MNRLPGELEPVNRLTWIKSHVTNSGFLEGYTFHQPDPELGWSMRPSSSGVIDDHKACHINSRGLRSLREFSYERTKSYPRIEIFGDSFTFGGEAADNEIFPYFLQKQLPHSEILNFGVSGYGQDQMLLYLEQEGWKYHPDIVMLGFIYGDCSRIPYSFRDYGKPQAYLDHGEIRWKNIPVPSPQQYLSREFLRLKTWDVLEMFYEAYWRPSIAYERYDDKVCGAVMTKMTDYIRKIGARPIFVHLLAYQPLGNPGGPAAVAEEAKFFGFCKQARAECVSTREAFEKGYESGERFVTRHHYRALENGIAANVIADYLKMIGALRSPHSR